MQPIQPQVILAIVSAAASLASAFFIYRVKAGFYEWLDRYNKELEDKFVLQKVYNIEHPHHGEQQRRHAQ